MQAKERPRMRRWIVMRGVCPHIENGAWDGFGIEYPNGKQVVAAGNLLKQMRLMAAEGHWGKLRRPAWERARTW